MCIDIQTQRDDNHQNKKMCWQCLFLVDKLHYVVGKTLYWKEVKTERCLFIAVHFLFLYKFTDDCQRVKTQLH